MRTAQILKLSAYVVIPVGALLGLKFFSVTSAEFWAVLLLSVLLWLILRIIAIAGDLVFDIRNEFARLFSNIERGIYYSNSISKEIRDLVESERVERDVH